MITHIKNWHKKQPEKRQLVNILVINWLFWFACWFIGGLIFENWLFGLKYSLLRHLYSATFMATLFLLLSHWGPIKSAFKK